MSATQTYLTRREAASVLRVSEKTLTKLINAGQIPVIRLDRTIRIPSSALGDTRKETRR